MATRSEAARSSGAGAGGVARAAGASAGSASGAAGSDFVNSFVKSALGDEGASGAYAGVASARSVEAIGREQQRRAVAYGRSRGQL